MKKHLIVLGMVVSLLGLSACGAKEEPKPDFMNYGGMDEAAVIEYAEYYFETTAMYSGQDTEELAYLVSTSEYADSLAYLPGAVRSYDSALVDMGEYIGILDAEITSLDEKEAIVTITIDGANKDAKVEVIIDKDMTVSSMTVNVERKFGELMKTAGLNTLIGMGTVFSVLILISLIISCFNFIPKIQEAFTKKSKEDVKAQAVDNTIAQIVEKEELSDDLELVAVIAAAIAASEGQATTDGFVVRSIRRHY